MRVGNGLGDVRWPSLIYICTLVLLWIDIDALSINQKSIIQYKTYHHITLAFDANVFFFFPVVFLILLSFFVIIM